MEGTFLRQEYKYRINVKKAEAFVKATENRLQADPYPEYDLHNIYFDTEDYKIASYCQQSHAYKEKLRLRSYGNPVDGQPVYLEIKKKFQNLSSKRRISLSMQQAEEYLLLHQDLDDSTEIYKEIDVLFHRTVLVPKIFISYHRIAFAGTEEPDLRITLDQNLVFRDHNVDLTSHGDEIRMIDDNEVMMEIKAMNAMPLWLVRILSELDIRRTAFSKYNTAYSRIASESKDISHVSVHPVVTGRKEIICSLPY